MDWPNFLYDQTDLAKICRHWPASITEFHAQNTLYGHHLIYKEYAGLPVDEPLPWVIEHAISFDKPEPYFAHVQSCLPLILSISESQAQLLRRKSASRVEPVGSAFFYMEKLFRKKHPGLLESGGERRGTLVFPCKSSKNEDWDHDSAAFAKQLASLPEEYQPVYVSVFWRDYERGMHREFERAGLPLVSAGNQEDPSFLYRSLDMCRQFKYACANQIATSFCYAVLGGCRFFYWPNGGVSITRDGETRFFESDPTLDLPDKVACAAASPFPPQGDAEAQRVLAEQFAGRASIRPPEFFQDLYREGHQLMRALVPASVTLDPVERLDRLSPWQPRSIDSDGWAMERAGLTIPHRDGYAGVRIRLEVPPRSDADWEAEWCLTMDGHAPCFIRVQGGSYELEIPAPELSARNELRIQASDPVLLQREARMRCYQVTAIEWIESLSAEPFSWGYHKGPDGVFTPVKEPESASFGGNRIALAERASWLFEGVDEAGRVSRACSFIIPARTDQAGVRLKIGFGDSNSPERHTRLSVYFDDEAPGGAVTEISTGSWYLEAPVRQDGRSRRVVVSMLPDADRAEKANAGAAPEFRIKQIQWRPSLTLKLDDHREQRCFHRLEDLKRLTSQPHAAAQSRWRRFLSGWIRKRCRSTDGAPSLRP